jgi:hypothetical protein
VPVQVGRGRRGGSVGVCFVCCSFSVFFWLCLIQFVFSVADLDGGTERRVAPRLVPSSANSGAPGIVSRCSPCRRRGFVPLVSPSPHFFVTVPSSRPPGIIL